MLPYREEENVKTLLLPSAKQTSLVFFFEITNKEIKVMLYFSSWHSRDTLTTIHAG